MKIVFSKISLLVISYMSILPLMCFLFFTNQSKEMDKLITVIRTSTNY